MISLRLRLDWGLGRAGVNPCNVSGPAPGLYSSSVISEKGGKAHLRGEGAGKGLSLSKVVESHPSPG